MTTALNKTKLIVVARSLKKVFIKPQYISLAIVVGLALLVIAVWLPNLHLITKTIASEKLTVIQKTNIAVSFLGAIETNFTPFSRTLTITTTFLSGINVALLAYYLRTRVALEKEAGISIGGMAAGFLGVGCASCGSVILSTIFGLSAAAGFIGVLPLKGSEFGILGVGLLIFSIYLVANKIENPVSCEIKN